ARRAVDCVTNGGMRIFMLFLLPIVKLWEPWELLFFLPQK
ncbi:aminotransferase class I and II family protein, partial [Chlamydia psittaci 84-8471/1]